MEFTRRPGLRTPPLTLTRMALVAASVYVRPHTVPRTLRYVRPERWTDGPGAKVATLWPILGGSLAGGSLPAQWEIYKPKYFCFDYFGTNL